MNGQLEIERKREAKRQLEDGKKQPRASHSHAVSLSEGPMLLEESKKVEAWGRASFEKSAAIELAAIKKRLQKLRLRKKKKEGKAKKSRGLVVPDSEFASDPLPPDR